MTDTLREYAPTVAIAAAAAFVLSFAIGLFRNPFGVALLRSLGAALAFGGLAAGARYVVIRYLPGLWPGTEDRAGDTAAAADREPAAAEGDAGTEAELVQEAEAVADVTQPTIDIVLPEEYPLPPEPADEVAAAEPVEADREPGPASPAAGGSRPLDALPDIGALAEEDSTGRTPARRRIPFAGTTRMPERPSDAARNLLEREEPSSLARAVRTVLKKDERA